ncbi:hypothetical protein EDD21DRAFT_448293 [Dissophora ornata]|nr:hypothetical protein EDD21DRAFT_448293 [Dissophora ornata]
MNTPHDEVGNRGTTHGHVRKHYGEHHAMVYVEYLTSVVQSINPEERTPLRTSFAYIPHGVGAIVTTTVLTKLVTKIRTKILMVTKWFFFIASGIVWAQVKVDSTYWEIPFPSLVLNFLGIAPVWLCCQINSVAGANDEDQGVVGAVYNVALQIGAPIGIGIANIIANTLNLATAVGADLLPGYQAAFYSVAVMAGVGLVLAIILAANSDPVKKDEQLEPKTLIKDSGPHSETQTCVLSYLSEYLDAISTEDDPVLSD